MKTTIIGSSCNSTIDWTKRQIVKSKETGNYFLVMGAGCDNYTFKGICIVAAVGNEENVDYIYNGLRKEVMTLVDSPVIIKFEF